jgi:DNA ligase (NAD+)
MQPIIIPTNCPVCDSKLQLVKDQLFCRNSSCEAQVAKKIEHFAKTLKIKGLGPATIAKLDLDDITQIYYLDKDEVAEVIGIKMTDKLMLEIHNSKTSDFATVLSAMSIPLIGNTASTKIAEFANNFEDLNNKVCKDAGLGEKATASLQDWIYFEYPQIKEFLPFKFEGIVKQPVNGPVVCITGKLKSFATKKDAALALNAKGYKVVDNLTKTVNFLIDEEDKSSTKRVKAESYGITVITDLNNFLYNN